MSLLLLISALEARFDAAGDLSPDVFDRFGQLIPATWIEQAPHATNAPSLRRRRLPAERLTWLVIGSRSRALSGGLPAGVATRGRAAPLVDASQVLVTL